MKQNEKTSTLETATNTHRIRDSLLMICLTTFLFLLGGQIVGLFFDYIPFLRQTDVGVTFLFYIQFTGIWIVTVLCISLSRINRPILKAITNRPSGNNWKGLLLGFLIGFLLNAVCVLIAWLHKDIHLEYNTFNPFILLLLLLTVFIQASAEELLCRVYLYQRLRKKYRKPVIAIVGNASFFALLHLPNQGVTLLSVFNILVFGILFTLVVYYMDSVWCAMAIHTAWNYTQNIIFGLPNSGFVFPYSVFKLDTSNARYSFAYHVNFGIEGAVLANIVLAVACVFLFLWGRKNGKKEFNVWK